MELPRPWRIFYFLIPVSRLVATAAGSRLRGAAAVAFHARGEAIVAAAGAVPGRYREPVSKSGAKHYHTHVV